MNERELTMLVTGLAPVIKQLVADSLAPLQRRIEEMEGREALPGRDGANGRDGIDGKDGADADMARAFQHIDAQIAKAIAALPPPERGEKGDSGADGADGRDGAGATGALIGRDGNLVLTLADGKAVDLGVVMGRDGKDADPEYIEQVVAEKVAALPPAKDGRDGRDVSPDEVRELVAAEVRAVVAALPVPKDGKDGRDGVDGKDADMVALSAHLRDLVAEIPAPVRGEKGEKGEPGENGADGRDGIDGKDGASIVNALIDSDGMLALAFSNGDIQRLGVVVGQKGADGKDGVGIDGKDGVDGRDGIDGLGFEDMRVEQINERQAKVVFERAGRVKEFPLNLPGFVYRGVWTDGEFEAGDAVTFSGSLFIAQETTSDKPEASKAWRLAVKRGKDGARGDSGKDGANGRDGKDWRPPGLDGVVKS